MQAARRKGGGPRFDRGRHIAAQRGGRRAARGPYDELQETYVALERWIEQNGWRANGAPWEVYLNEPSLAPDPKDWRTEVCWPIAKN